jgi:sugar phosphate isomerase/epimerase
MLCLMRPGTDCDQFGDVMNRRDALRILALAGAIPCSASELAVESAKSTSPRPSLGLVIHSYWIRRERPLFPDFGSVAEPLAFLEAAAKIGAAGIQTTVSGLNPTSLATFRAALEGHALYVEGMIGLPKNEADLARFETELVSSKQAGATVLRTVCMSGRRYENFTAAEQFRQFADQSWKSLALAEPVAARHHIRLAVENHKDWRTNEMVEWLTRLSSEFVGVCLDTGNNMALLEEPHAVVEALAPFTFTTHLKDMGLAECDDGFLLSEVPLGTGCLDLKRVVGTLQKANPTVRLNLEMITRDPLRVPCLSPKYWTTLSEIPGRELAEALARVRQHKQPLPTITKLSHEEQLRAEADNIDRCLKFADDNFRA